MEWYKMEPPILRMEGIEKSFPGVKALRGVDLSVQRGEVHALLGENGAGKSTLMKILAGAYRKDAGLIYIDSRKVEFNDPKHARELGIAIIYQELSILPHLSVGENIFLGRMPRRQRNPWLIDWNKCYERARELLDRLGLKIDPRIPASRLKVAEQQMVEIAKALSHNANLVVMDEPTTSLTTREVDTLFTTIRLLREQRVSVIYISHRLVEVKGMCDRATVLRDGKTVGTVRIEETGERDWVRMMVGRDLDQIFPKSRIKRGKEILRVSNLTSRKLKNISFSAYEGEILGIAGLVGAGRTTLARAVFGADPVTSGTIEINGQRVVMRKPSSAIQTGVALVPEDRKGQGVVLSMVIRENITLANLNGVSRAGQLKLAVERRVAKEYVQALRIATPSINQETVNLSGGNQQKVVLAKWLYSASRVLIVDEPTRGIDVGAKAEIYSLLHQLIEQGSTILMISSELPELIGMSDRILVMHEGRIAGELSRDQFSEEAIMVYAAGLGDEAPPPKHAQHT
jgi:ribose transport system ATP-binding protein